MVESMVLSSSGGLMGILLGVAIPVAVSRLSEIETALSWWAIIMAFSTSVLTGVVFGVYPARRAALMNPIESPSSRVSVVFRSAKERPFAERKATKSRCCSLVGC